MGITGFSKSQVPSPATFTNEVVTAVRNRPIDAGPDIHMWVEAVGLEVQMGDRIGHVSVVGVPSG